MKYLSLIGITIIAAAAWGIIDIRANKALKDVPRCEEAKKINEVRFGAHGLILMIWGWLFMAAVSGVLH